MGFKISMIPLLGVAFLLIACSRDQGTASAYYSPDGAAVVRAVTAEGGRRPCIRSAYVTRYLNDGSEKAVRRYDVPPAKCVSVIDLNSPEFLQEASGDQIRRGRATVYNIFVEGDGLDTNVQLVDSARSDEVNHQM